MSDGVEIAIQGMIEDALQQVNTMQPGKVVSYDPATRRAVVQGSVPKRTADDDTLPAPEVHAVPVMFPTGAGGRAGLTYPIGPGDGLSLHFAQRSLEGFLGGSEDAPDDPRQFDITDAVATPGLSAKSPAANPTDVELYFGDAKLRLQPDGTAVFETAGGSLTIDARGGAVLKGLSLRVESPATFTAPVVVESTLTVAGVLINTHQHIDSRGGRTSGPLNE